MKKLVLFFLGVFLFAEGLYNNTPKMKFLKTQLNLLLKVSMKNDIKSISLSKYLIAVMDDSKVKLFDVENGDLIKSFNIDNGVSVKIYQNKLFILSNNNFFIYNLKDFKLISNKPNNSSYYRYLDINKGILGIVRGGWYVADIYNLKKGQELSSFQVPGSWLEFSPNNKYLISSDKVYTLRGDLYTNLGINFNSIDWINDENLIYINDKSIYMINIKNSNKTGPFYNAKKENIDYIYVLNFRYALVFNKNKIRVFDIKNKKLLKKEFILKTKESIKEVRVLKNKILISNRYGTNAYLYDISSILNYLKINIKHNFVKNIIPTKKTKEIKAKKIIKITKKITVSNKTNKDNNIVVKKVNKKPFLKFYASNTNGVAPLKVDFKILCNDSDGKIIAYYMNFAGKEEIGKGDPNGKSFSYTFRIPGEYNIMFAVKDNQNAISTSEIKIRVREESFEDYKKSLIGK